MFIPDADPLADSLAELPRLFPRPPSPAWWPNTAADLHALDLELSERGQAIRLELPPGALRVERLADGSWNASATWTPGGWLVPAPLPPELVAVDRSVQTPIATPPPGPPDLAGLVVWAALLILASFLAGLGLGAALRALAGWPILGGR